MNEQNKQKAMEAFSRFLDTISTLRAPGGCPWDIDQTPLSMRQDLIEEAFEACDAISQNDINHVKEELGDVFLNAMMISYMYEESGQFLIADSINDLTDKLIRRHPHVFPQSEGSACMSQKPTEGSEVLSQWDKIKENIEGRKGESVLDDIPEGFPPLLKAQKMQKKAAKKGFKWSSIDEAKEKLLEEMNEVFSAQDELYKSNIDAAADCSTTLENQKSPSPLTVNSCERQNQAFLHLEEELGDLLFSAINYGRYLNINSELAMEKANKKFSKRFRHVEKSMAQNNLPMDENHLKEMLFFWKEAKNQDSSISNNEKL